MKVFSFQKAKNNKLENEETFFLKGIFFFLELKLQYFANMY